MNPNQRQFLDRLNPEQLRRKEMANPGKRAALLAPFASGFDRARARLMEGELPRGRPGPEPAPARKAIERLPGGSPALIPKAAELLCREFEREQDRRLWGAFRKLAKQVWRGEVDVELVLDADRQGMGPGARNRGAVFATALMAGGGWRPG